METGNDDWHQSEHKESFPVSVDQLMKTLLKVLPRLGWQEVDIFDFGMTAHLKETEKNYFTVIVTCVPCKGMPTELLLTVCSHIKMRPADDKLASILNEVRENTKNL